MTIAVETKTTSDMVLFAQVVEAGTITGGSRSVGLERSTVSRRITSLEERLGIPLLDRTSRTLGLTEAGRLYYEHCLKVVEAAEDAEAIARGFRVEPHGVLNVYASVSEVESFLTELIAAFCAENRNVRIELSLCDNAAMRAPDITDIGLCLGPVPHEGLGARKLASVGESLWASPRYVRENSAIETPADLDQHAWISHVEPDRPLRWHFSRGDATTAVSSRPRFPVHSLVSARQAAIAGLGIALLPNYLCREAECRGELVQVLPAWAPPSGDLLALFPTERFLARKASAFLDFARHELTDGQFRQRLA